MSEEIDSEWLRRFSIRFSSRMTLPRANHNSVAIRELKIIIQPAASLALVAPAVINATKGQRHPTTRKTITIGGKGMSGSVLMAIAPSLNGFPKRLSFETAANRRATMPLIVDTVEP